MRLIDADALLKRLRKDPIFQEVERYGISGVIDAEPTALCLTQKQADEFVATAKKERKMADLERGHLEGKQPPNLFYRQLGEKMYWKEEVEKLIADAKKRSWESGYLTALGDVRKRVRDLEDYIADLASAILETPVERTEE